MAKLLLLGAFVASANAGAVELTKSNFDAEVKNSGKNAFVKVCSYISLPRAPLPHACDACASSRASSSRASQTHAFLTRHLLCFLFVVSAQFLAPW